jgi:GNAT superfamily N-acetyltransferase
MTAAPDVLARPATSDDRPAISDLMAEARASIAGIARGGSMWQLHDADRRSNDSQLDSLLSAAAAEKSVLLAGTLDGFVVGYAIVWRDDLADGRYSARVSDLWVTEEGRSVGVGAALIAAVVEWASAKRCIGIDAWALPGERETKNFFEAAGFTARMLVVHHSLGASPGGEASPEEQP